MHKVRVIGGGLAGSEAAWQLAERGIGVTLYEMRPMTMTPAHHSGDLGELVCSNSLRAKDLGHAAGLLKEELRRAGSLIMRLADAHAIGAGGALAVDRVGFQRAITEAIETHPLITLQREEIREIPEDGITLVASGPLTSDALSASLKDLTGAEQLYFYDAAAPIVSKESIHMEDAFWQSRYDKGQAEDYLNCPMDEATYANFYRALLEAPWAETKDFEDEVFFEGCMPIETMAARGRDTLRFGPMKPVGLVDPATGETPYAVVQLRHDDAQGQLMNIVGFQTRMRWGAQEDLLKRIPALRDAEIVRYGVMHRNTYMNSPQVLLPTGQLKARPSLLFAGQMTGVEGYIESTAGGLVAGINAARLALEQAPLAFPATTAIGALLAYITSGNGQNFQPMNINFGLLPPLAKRVRNKKERGGKYAERALTDLQTFLQEHNLVS
ncbi:FADH(2)-oxidizing methylenetetrahydrofolate--tRNA-(uracil(54)-C(5))-methyltransferase TrmFO [Peptococcus niger]|uniref:Methylenetetrahydrofolate--tRNA-(uracil-5-)-methyltransferase TrmFO n=1 Tax=Peptococcus niger TaxID=2741 RepID=A0A1G6ZB67_PEPNI|nr:FADH(2)-oxidizing methylenetetrahydrofolate--tRNA-(uracil(54)-C(5))-methyltransferase TrmFO [Peptococcus niger]SDD99543.1 methylenetetrahydrofolate--tRNA-(uracil-5-)-methyltransferase [Peptococcus niger]